MDITFSNGAKVANRKLILENIIERLVRESNRPIVVFYKSPYLINQFSEWYRTQNTRRKCSVISSSMIAHGLFFSLEELFLRIEEPFFWLLSEMSIIGRGNVYSPTVQKGNGGNGPKPSGGGLIGKLFGGKKK